MPTVLSASTLSVGSAVSAFDVACRLARPTLSDDAVADARAYFEAGGGMDEVIEEAVFHRVPLLVARNLLTHLADVLTDERRTWLVQELETAVYRDRVMLQELARILDGLDQGGVPALAFKGVAYGLLAYETLGLRPYSDLDVWIPRAQHSEAAALLDGLGYATAEGARGPVRQRLKAWLGRQVTYKRGEIFQLDLHLSLMPQLYPMPDAFAAWHARAEPLAVPGRAQAVLTFDRPDALIALCYQGTKDRWEYLKHVVDVADLARRLTPQEWETVRQRAERLRATRIVALALLLARALVAVPLPAHIEAWSASFEALPALVDELAAAFPERRNEGHFGYLKRARYHLQILTTPRDRTRYIVFSGARRLIDRALPEGV